MKIKEYFKKILGIHEKVECQHRYREHYVGNKKYYECNRCGKRDWDFKKIGKITLPKEK